jgi:hypothetical protein
VRAAGRGRQAGRAVSANGIELEVIATFSFPIEPAALDRFVADLTPARPDLGAVVSLPSAG